MYSEEKYKEFSERMEERFPNMYSGKYGGFSVGPGWWPIIESLSANIQQHVDWANRKEKVCPQVVVEQVKEKFGGLRFYYQGGDEQIHGMVRMAEAWAGTSCEECGAPGSRIGGGWVRTLCEFHNAEREATRAEAEKKEGFAE
jgi:hypothetical protein